MKPKSKHLNQKKLKQTNRQEKDNKGLTKLVNLGGIIEKKNSTGIITAVTPTSRDDQPLAIATEQRHRESACLLRNGPISGIAATL